MIMSPRALLRRAVLGAGFTLCMTGAATAQAPDRSKPPELGPPPTLTLPPMKVGVAAA